MATANYQNDTRSTNRIFQARKKDWLYQREEIEERERRRLILYKELEEAPAELKRIITPMFHIKIVQQYLWMVYAECKEKGGEGKKKRTYCSCPQ